MTFLRTLAIALCLMPVAAGAASKPAQIATTSSAIAAVVNDDVITGYDLDARIKFVLATTHISNTPDSIARLKPQILRVLVDEKLQMQEAAKNKIEVGDKEVAQAIASIESQRSMTPGAINNMLSANHIPKETFENQVRAQIVWSKLLQRKVRSQIKITDEDIEQMMHKLSAPVVKQEMKIALWQIPVDKPERAKEVRAAAEKMVLEVRKGADFEELARQFPGGGVREGGKIAAFWVRPDDLDPAIAKALTGAKAGFITDPLQNNAGFAIIKVYDTRDLPGGQPVGTEITFKEITLKLRSSADKKEADTLKDIAEEVAKHPGTCEEKSVAGIGNAETASIAVAKTTQMLADMPPALRVIADGMKVGDISSPLASDDGIKLYMLCGKRDGVTAPVDAERAKAAVYQQRMELEAQRYMRNLRRDGFVEVRG